MASCAAPTYFPALQMSDGKGAYVDGGLWANCPGLCAVIKLAHFSQISFKDIKLLSIGNGKHPEGLTAQKFNKFRLWKTITPLFEMMFTAQMAAADDLAKCLLGDNNFLCLDQDLPEKIALDDVENALEILPDQAAQCVRQHSEKLKEFLTSTNPVSVPN
jgi:hypothetical protein